MEHKDITEINGFRKLLIIAIVFVLLFFAAIGVSSFILQIYDKMTQPPRVASKEMKRLMKYHNTSYSECDWKGQCWFYRDGKRCRLWEKK